MNQLEKYLIKKLKPKFNAVSKFKKSPKHILDIGIANNSYVETKTIFPDAVYTGVDIQELNFEMTGGDVFYKKNLEEVDDLDFINGTEYDVILINHVLEHLSNGERVYEMLCCRLAKGGIIYAEFPSIETMRAEKNKYNYHFHDDPTHKRVYCLETLANIAMDKGLKILSCGNAGTMLKNILGIPRACYALLKGAPPGPQLLFLQKKISYIAAVRPRI